jgi:autotransporter-associated beta strand protein
MPHSLRARAHTFTRHSLRSVLSGGAALCAVLAGAAAQDATWLQNPGSSDWNTGTNWNGGVVPTGTATFGASNVSTLTFSAATTSLQSIQLTSAAPAYQFKSDSDSSKKVVLTGSGIINQSTQEWTLGTSLELHNAATAGNASIHVLEGSGISMGAYTGRLKFFDTAAAGTAHLNSDFRGETRWILVEFHDSSSAGSATINNGASGATSFYDTSSAGNATFTASRNPFENEGGRGTTSVNFNGSSSAGNATFNGYVNFYDNSTAANATLSGPFISFRDNSTSGSATFIIDQTWAASSFNGSDPTNEKPRLIIRPDATVFSDRSMEIGSIEGQGMFRTESTMTLGKNDLSTTFDGLLGATWITKVGTGTLTINGTIDGRTTVQSGGLKIGDASHPGAHASTYTDVGSAGNLSGTGTISADLVNVHGGTVEPGDPVGTLTVGSYSQGSNGTLEINVDSTGASLLKSNSYASLDGTLLLNFAADFSPTQPLENFTILSASQIGGQFSTVNTNGLGSFSFGINYFPTFVQLSVLAGGATIDAAFAAITAPYNAPANSFLYGVTDIGSPRPINLLGPVTLDTVTHTIGLSGVISGTGPFTIAGNGTAILSAANTYTGGTTVNSGATLQIGSGGTTGSILGNVTDNGTLAFNRSDSATFAGVISGSGQLVQAGTGTTILTGTNTYSGGTTITGGTLQIGAGGTTGSIVGNVVDNGTLAFNHGDTVTFGAVISGTGGLNQLGAGTLILNSVNTYHGNTTVSGGTLLVGDGTHAGASLAGNVTVASGATLGGFGTIAGSVTNGGTVAPGASIGTLTVGSYTQSSGGTLAIEMAPTANDLLKVTGAASLNGTLALSVAPGTYGSSDRTVVQAGALSGTFSALTVTGGGNLAVGVRYTPTLANVVIEPKQNAELYSGFHKQAFATAETLNDLVFTHMRTAYCKDADATAGRANEPACPELSVWYQGFGSVGTMDATGDRTFNTRAAGLIGGFDYRYDNGYTFGIAASYSAGTLGLDGRAGKVSTNTFSIAATGGAPLFEGRLDLDALYVSMTGNASRIVAPDGGAALTAVSHPKATAYLGAAQYSYPVLVSGLDAFARVTYGRTSLAGFTETGAAPFDFAVASQGKDSGYADLGARFSEIIKMRSGSIVIPEISVAVRGDFGGMERDVTARLADASGASFTAPGADRGNVAFVLGFGVTAENRNGFELYVRGNGRASGGEKEGVLTFGSRYTF